MNSGNSVVLVATFFRFKKKKKKTFLNFLPHMVPAVKVLLHQLALANQAALSGF
uniref:Uncharacterized protein n=1 Tax=Anguilla anguilla TaxID=7936 RepID=A0A0E9X0H9_ANGAN